MTEYRVYGKPNCNLFTLFNKGELAQSESFGWVLSQSESALRTFIRLIRICIKSADFFVQKWQLKDKPR